MKLLKTMMLVAGLFLLTNISTAQQRQGKQKMDPEKKFEMIDVNKDGYVDLNEFKAAHAKRPKRGGRDVDPEKIFARKDANSDNLLDLDEFKSRPQRGNKR